MKKTQLILLTFTLALNAYAGSATWNLNPATGDWNTAANWNPPTVPNGPSDTATFAVSNQPAVMLSADTDVNNIVFNAGASTYSTTVPAGLTLTLENGITNNSGITQSFLINGGTVAFNGGNAGLNTNFLLTGAGSTILFNSGNAQTGTYTIEGAGQIIFSNFATAGFGNTFTLNGNDDTVPGLLEFTDNAGSSSAIITLNGNGAGANCMFLGHSHTFSGTFTANGADSVDHNPGVISFGESSDGGGAVLIANGGTNGGAGGKIIYTDSAFSSGYVKVYGDGSLDISGDVLGALVTFLEGDGSVFLGGENLTVSSDANSTFSGQIQDGGINGGTGGVLTKKGRGTLTLTGANTYTAGTIVSAINPNRKGTLAVSNTAGSGLGTGAVSVNLGTLGGSGTIAGAVTIGTGSGSSQVGFLAPAAGGRKPVTLNIQSLLTFKGNGAYNYTLQARDNRARADRVNARGVTIESGAQFVLLADQVQGTLPIGTSFVVINNTAATAINGTFANLADGAILNVNGNNLQASYEGGAGNDLTLTVVP